MTASTSSSPGTPDAPQPRHRASGGRYGRETETSGPTPAVRREGGRHRAPDAPPSSGFTIVPGPREDGTRDESDGPGAGFRPLPPAGPTPPGPTPPTSGAPPSPGVSSIGVPLGAVPTQREPVPRRRHPDPAVPRPRPARPDPDARDDEAATVPIRREALDRAAAHRPAEALEDPPLRPLTQQRPTAAAGPRPAPRPAPRPRTEAPENVPPRPAGPPRGVAPWETPPVDQASARLGLVAVVLGLLGALVALVPASGLLPRLLPTPALGITPVFTLVGALLGVVALGLGTVAMFRAVATSCGLLAGVVGACAGAAAIVVGLLV